MIKIVKNWGNALSGPRGRFLVPTVEITVGKFFIRVHGIARINGKFSRQNKAGFFTEIFSGKHCFPGQMA